MHTLFKYLAIKYNAILQKVYLLLHSTEENCAFYKYIALFIYNTPWFFFQPCGEAFLTVYFLSLQFRFSGEEDKSQILCRKQFDWNRNQFSQLFKMHTTASLFVSKFKEIVGDENSSMEMSEDNSLQIEEELLQSASSSSSSGR